MVADDAALAFAHRLWLTAADSATLRQAKPINLACHRAFAEAHAARDFCA
jgi:hypothetical protein